MIQGELIIHKFKLLTKRSNEKLTLNQTTYIIIISEFLILSLFLILIKNNYYLLLFLIIPLILLWLYISYIAINKTAHKKYMCMQHAALKVIKSNLSSSFTKVNFILKLNNNIINTVFSNLNLNFWAKIDEDDTITLIAKDINNTIIHEEKTQNYLWFINNFYY